jgi:hypothetical protein
MAVTRFYMRQSQTEPTTGGTVYDLGATADTGTVAVSGTASVLTEFGRWVRELSANELPVATISVPYQVSIASQSTNTESRIVIARLNSSGAIQQSVNGATYTGTAATTLSGTVSLSGFVQGDLVAIIVENRRTSGGGSRTTTVNTTSSSYVDVTAPNLGVAANISGTANAGNADGSHPALIPLGTAANISATSEAGIATGFNLPLALKYEADKIYDADDVTYDGALLIVTASSVGAAGSGAATATVSENISATASSTGGAGSGAATGSVESGDSAQSVGAAGGGVAHGRISVFAVAISVGAAGAGIASEDKIKIAAGFSIGAAGNGNASYSIARFVAAASVAEAGSGVAKPNVSRKGTAFSVGAAGSGVGRPFASKPGFASSVGFPGTANAVGVSALPLSFILPDHPVWTKRDVLTVSGPTRQSKYF